VSAVSGYVATLAGARQHELSEGPRWDDATGTVTWVDIVQGHVYRGTVDDHGVTGERIIALPDTVGAAVPMADGGMLVAAHDRLLAVSPDGSRHESAPVVDGSKRLRLNDGAVDPAGRLLVGSLALDHRAGAAALFRLEPDGTTTVLRDGLNLANGIGWSPDGTTLYLNDSVPGTVWTADYDVGSGEPRRWRPLVTDLHGAPDGLVVDADGDIWVAEWNAARVTCFSPDGDVLHVVHVPVPHVTAVAFVGPERDRMLITSARDELEPERLAQFPLSGLLFLADVDAVGLPTSRWTGAVDGAGWTRVTAPDPTETP
jgi:sugar lactone lactonase YvrE